MRWSLALSLSFFLGLALGSWRVREVFSSPSSAYQSALSELCLTQSQQSELSKEPTTGQDESLDLLPQIKVVVAPTQTKNQQDQGGADVESESAQISQEKEPDIPEQTETLESEEADPEGPRRKRR